MPTEAELKQRLARLYEHRRLDGSIPALEVQIAKVEKQLKRLALNEDPKIHLAQIQKRLHWLKDKIGTYEFEYKHLIEEANALQDQIEAQQKEGS